MAEYRGLNDSLRGDRIAVSARSISTVMVEKRSHAHKAQFAVLRDNAWCVIEIPLKVVLNKKQ